jgi:hypothetical protein
VSHGGAWAGYRAELLRFPEQHLSVTCLCNLAQTNPSMLARRVADVYLGDRMTPANAANVTAAGRRASDSAAGSWTPAATELTRYAGRYESAELETSYSFSVENGKLMLHRRRSPPIALTPTNTDTFVAEGISYRFIRDRNHVTGFLVDAGRTKNLRFDAARGQ